MMAPAGRPPIDPEKRRVKLNLNATSISVETWAYTLLSDEARATDASMKKLVETVVMDYARKLRRRKSK